jgi:RHS repeat-associated protein
VGTIYKVWDLNAKALADVRTYDSFGNLISQTGTTKTPLGFQGKYYDQESGLNYFYYRYYNPALGRFISEDPIGLNGGLNLQKFVNSNPINSIDPTGIIDAISFPDPSEYENSKMYPTLPDYIWWTTEGMIKGIINAATGSGTGCPCQDLFWKCMSKWFLPGLGDVFQTTFTLSGYWMQVYAWHYAETRAIGPLVSPLMSKKFARWFLGGGNIGPFYAVAYTTTGFWFCLIKEIKCLKNQ